MANKLKKFFAVLLTMSMCLSMVTFSASAAEAGESWDPYKTESIIPGADDNDPDDFFTPKKAQQRLMTLAVPAAEPAPFDPYNDAELLGEKYEFLKDAVAKANEIGEGEITLLRDVDLVMPKDGKGKDAAITVSGDVTIAGPYTVTRPDAYTGTLFSIAKNAKLALEELTVDGGNEWTFQRAEFMTALTSGEVLPDGGTKVYERSARFVKAEEGAPVATASVFVVNGELELNEGAVMQNHVLANGDNKYVISVGSTGGLTMDGAVLQHNAKYGSQTLVNVSAGGLWTVEDAEMTDNFGSGNGSLASVQGKAYIEDIDFHDNYGTSNGMFRVNANNSYMEINGGDFYHNYMLSDTSNNWNGMVYVHNSGCTFVMNGGSMRENHCDMNGGVSAKQNGTSTIIINGGKIVNNVTYAERFGKGEDILLGNPLQISEGKTVDSEEVCLYNDFVNNGTLNANTVYVHGWATVKSGARVYSGEGTVNSNVYLFRNANTSMESGVWNGLTTVDAVNSADKNTSLTVEAGATIKGVQVRVLNSVPSGDYTNAEEATGAQDAAYVQMPGADVQVPVLYYHRLMNEQKSDIVVTYDYNGGLDAQGWSGIQVTGNEAYTPGEELTAPMLDGYHLIGWEYAVENDPESLSMEGTRAYNGETLTRSIRLIAQWGHKVSYEYENAPANAPALPEDQFYAEGARVEVAAEPELAGYGFSGWDVSVLNNGKMPDEDVVLVGTWLDPVSVTVRKVWSDGGSEEIVVHPESVEVRLMKDGQMYEDVTLSAENDWTYTWPVLDARYEWTVVEAEIPDNYVADVEQIDDTFVITNTYDPLPPPAVSLSVNKIWDNGGEENVEHPDSVKVHLLRNGEVYEEVILSEANGWTCNWDELDGRYDWTVVEAEVPENYEASVELNGDAYIITNTYVPAEEEFPGGGGGAGGDEPAPPAGGGNFDVDDENLPTLNPAPK